MSEMFFRLIVSGFKILFETPDVSSATATDIVRSDVVMAAIPDKTTNGMVWMSGMNISQRKSSLKDFLVLCRLNVI